MTYLLRHWISCFFHAVQRCLAGLIVLLATHDGQSVGAVMVGVAKVDVTPTHPVLLAGYGGRTSEHEGVDTLLWARAMAIGETKPAVIVALDN